MEPGQGENWSGACCGISRRRDHPSYHFGVGRQRRIENIADPVANQDVATKKYVVDNGGAGGAGAPVKSLTGLVPAMTGYTQAGFTVSASSEFNTTTFAAWRAFDGTTLQWAVLGSLTNFWIKIQLPSAKKVWKVELLGRPSNDVPRNYVIQGSTDAHAPQQRR